MTRRAALALTACLAAGALAGAATATVPVPSAVPVLAAGTSPVTATTRALPFPVRDTAGAQTGSRTWRVTDAGGNCCETYVVATPDGALAEFGGTFPLVSRDEGATWSRVDPPVPLGLGGEGTIVTAPDGDLVGVGWDPYAGDHLTSWRLDTATGQWQWAEQPLHTPFFDRQWLAVVPGPIQVGLQTVPYAFLLSGGYAALRNVLYLSSDGLHYDELSLAAADTLLGTAQPLGALPTTPYPAADWLQTPGGSPATPLNGGGALVAVGDGVSPCSVARIVPPSAALRCVSDALLPATLRQDSRGVLHRLTSPTADAFRYEVSPDGGRTWSATSLPVPYAGAELERWSPGGLAHSAVAVNGALRMAVVSTRVVRPQPDGSRPSQDLVFVLDTSGVVPRVAEVLEVGVGGVQTAGGLAVASTTARLDFTTVAITRDGRVATGYLDTTTAGPDVAVETGVTRRY